MKTHRLAPIGYKATPVMCTGDYAIQGHLDGFGGEHVNRQLLDGSMPPEVVPKDEIPTPVQMALRALKEGFR